MRRRLGAAILYVVVLLFALEAIARLFLAMPLIADRRVFHDELSWRRHWVRRHARGDEIRYGFDAYDPLLGWRLEPNRREVQVWHGKILNTNSRGFRGAREYAYGRQPDRPRIVVLGDSFTFGEEVGDAETYAARLQALMPSAEVINLGIHGFGHDQMLLLLQEEGIRYAPDVVLVGFVDKDMSRNLLEFRDYAKPKFRLDGGRLRLVGSPVPRPEAVLARDWARPRLRDLWSILAHEVDKWTGREARREAAVTARILGEMVDFARRVPATVVFAFLPVGDEIASRLPLTDGERFLFAVCQRHPAARCVSTRPAFVEAQAAGQTFKAAGHWDAAAHRIAAHALHGYLMGEPGRQVAGTGEPAR